MIFIVVQWKNENSISVGNEKQVVRAVVLSKGIKLMFRREQLEEHKLFSVLTFKSLWQLQNLQTYFLSQLIIQFIRSFFN